MSPKDQNIIDTLNLLTLLYRARKQQIPKLIEEEQYTLRITREHLTLAGLSISVFINTLEMLDNKGYLIAVSGTGEHFDAGIEQITNEENFANLTKSVEILDNDQIRQKLKESIADVLDQMKPAGKELDRQALMNENISLKGILEDSRKLIAGRSPDEISMVMLMPFRSIDRLLKKMNEGIRFDDVQDFGIWYNSTKRLFHVGNDTVPTSYNHKRNLEHFVLEELFQNSETNRIDYDEIPGFDKNRNRDKEKKSYQDAFKRFIKKHPELPKIFVIHTDSVEINKDYIEHTH